MTNRHQNIGIHDRRHFIRLFGSEEERGYGNELVDRCIPSGLFGLGVVLVGHESIDVGHGNGDAFSLEFEVVDAIVEPLDYFAAGG